MTFIAALMASTMAAATPIVEMPPTEPARVATFNVGGVELILPLPDDYCLPVTAAEIGGAQILAAGDTTNVTHLQIGRCDIAQPNARFDYTLVKTPRSVLAATVGRSSLIAGVGDEFNNPVTLANFDFGKAGADVSVAFGKTVTLAGAIKPLGRDDMCAYLGGVIDVKTGDMAYAQAVGACITAVGGRVVIVYRYGPDNTPAGVAKLVVEAKSVAGSIRD